jgi:AhpD family alkylhydroperoxidase
MIKNIATFLIGISFAYAADEKIAREYSPVPVTELEQSAKARVDAVARVPLSDSADQNYLRALSLTPGAVEPMKKLVNAALFTGGLDPELKGAMGLRISQLLRAPYVAAQLEYHLRSSLRGKTFFDALCTGKVDSLAPADRLAIDYAEWLTQDVHGVSDTDFRRVRQYYNDSQIVELTTTTCFFGYMTRFTEALRLPVEESILRASAAFPPSANRVPIARVALISDAELDAVEQAKNSVMAQQARNTLGLGLANSMRAMYLAPEMASAWFQYGQATRQYDQVSREIKLQISFAVSMANNCRYCTLHQVLGLKRLGVSPTKLLQMRKDDRALSPEELTAVKFARKLTAEPWSITDADYTELEKTFGEQGAVEVVMQTCNFAYMNHFTDGLRLPSEDEAVKTYREIYRTDFGRR